VDRLGFFTEVGVDTQEVPGAPDQVDLQVNVAEKPTGSITLGAGFSSYEKVALTFGVTQENAFGSGNYLALQVNTSKYNRNIVLSSTDPYFTEGGISRTADIFYRTTRPYYGDLNAYSVVSSGVGLRFGVPVTEKDTVFVGANLEQTEIRSGTGLPDAYIDYTNQFGSVSRAIPLTLGWASDGRDSALVPTRGRYQRAYADYSIAGDVRYYRANYQLQQYFPLTKQYTFAFNTDLGYGAGASGKPFPIFKNYYVGGLGSVRGFMQGTLGPTRFASATNSTPVYLGGTKKVVLNGEFVGPFPGAGNDKTLRMFAFVDAGYAYGENDPIRLSELRSSYGVGLSWISPMGPLKFSYGLPLRKHADDKNSETSIPDRNFLLMNTRISQVLLALIAGTISCTASLGTSSGFQDGLCQHRAHFITDCP